MLRKPELSKMTTEVVPGQKIPEGIYTGRFVSVVSQLNKNKEKFLSFTVELVGNNGVTYRAQKAVQPFQGVLFVAELYLCGVTVKTLEDVVDVETEFTFYVSKEGNFNRIDLIRPFPVEDVSVDADLPITIGQFQYFVCNNELTGKQEEITIQAYKYDRTVYYAIKTGETSHKAMAYLYFLYDQVGCKLIPVEMEKQIGKSAIGHVKSVEDELYFNFGKSDVSIKSDMIVARSSEKRFR